MELGGLSIDEAKEKNLSFFMNAQPRIDKIPKKLERQGKLIYRFISYC